MFVNRERQGGHSAEPENPYWMSFSDIMAGLLVIFILALVFLMIQLHQQTVLAKDLREDIERAIKELAHIEEMRKQILEEIQISLEKENIRVEVAENHTVLRIPEEQFYFERGRHHILMKLRDSINVIGEKILTALSVPERLKLIDTVFIEGHTDSTPMFGEMGNWGLSAFRAISLWKFWTESPGIHAGMADLQNRNRKPVFSVSGYAATRRVQEKETTYLERRRNRRIDVRFTMLTPEVGDLQKLLDRFRRTGG